MAAEDFTLDYQVSIYLAPQGDRCFVIIGRFRELNEVPSEIEEHLNVIRNKIENAEIIRYISNDNSIDLKTLANDLYAYSEGKWVLNWKSDPPKSKTDRMLIFTRVDGDSVYSLKYEQSRPCYVPSGLKGRPKRDIPIEIITAYHMTCDGAIVKLP